MIFLMLSILSLHALEWKSYEEGLKEAKKSGKLLMIDIVRDGCHYCSDMDHQVFSDSQMASWIEGCFVPVKINISHETLPKTLTVEVTPTFVFMPSDQTPVKEILGAWSKEDFKALSQTLCKEK